MLIMSNFFFGQSDFEQFHVLNLAIYPFPKQALVFTCVQSKSFENTVEKGEIARNEQFLFFPQCFLPICRTFCHLNQVRNCRLQTISFWKSLKFIVWETDTLYTLFYNIVFRINLVSSM